MKKIPKRLRNHLKIQKTNKNANKGKICGMSLIFHNSQQTFRKKVQNNNLLDEWAASSSSKHAS